MLKIQIARYIHELLLVKAHILRPHFICIDPAPDRMRVPPPVFFMEHKRAGVILQIKLALDLPHSSLEILAADLRAFGRVQAHGKQMLLAFGLARDGIQIFKCLVQIIADKATKIMQLDMLIVTHREQVACELSGIAARRIVRFYNAVEQTFDLLVSFIQLLTKRILLAKRD